MTAMSDIALLIMDMQRSIAERSSAEG